MGKNGRGRDREEERRWREVIREAARSGMSIREFCRRREIKEGQFYRWQRNLKGREQERGLSRQGKVSNGEWRASFALVSDESAELGAAGIELVLSGGRRLRISKGVDAQTLRTVLEVAEATARSPGE